MENTNTPVELKICPTCKQKSLMLNESSNRYECLNVTCKDSFFRTAFDKFEKQNVGYQETLEAISTNKARAWAGNQYYDSKKKKWRDGKKPKRLKLGRWNWLRVFIIFLIISILITIILNCFFPNSGFAFFIF
jgi:hypothetical protein